MCIDVGDYFFVKWNGTIDDVSHRVAEFCRVEAGLNMTTNDLRALVGSSAQESYEDGM